MRKKSLFWHRGSATFYLLLGVVIIGAVFLVGGFAPLPPSAVDTTPAGEPFLETPGDSQNNLQLQTFKFKGCSSQLNMDLLLDRSGSMNNPTLSGNTKINALKEAVATLFRGLSDDSIIGIQSFNSYSLTNDIPISYYKDIKSRIPTALNALIPEGQTPTHDALAFSYGKLQEALPQFPGKKINFIVITDGLPVPPTQDPRLFNPNPADQIKQLAVPIYVIGLHGIEPTTKQPETSDPNFASLLASIASKPENYFEAPTGDELTKLLGTIAQKICAGVTPTP